MRNKLLGSVAGAAALMVAGYVYADSAAQARLDAAIVQAREAIGQNGELTVQSAKADVWSSSVRLTGVAVRTDVGTTTLDELVLSVGKPDRIQSATARGVRHDGADVAFSLSSVAIEGGVLHGLAAGRALDPAMVSFDLFRIEGLNVRASGKDMTVGSLQIGGYGVGRHTSLSASSISVPVSGKPEFDRISAGGLSLAGVDLASIFANAVSGRSPGFPPGDVAFELVGLAGTKGGSRLFEVARTSLSVRKVGSAQSQAEFTIHGMVGKSSAETAARLSELGYEEVGLDIEARVTHNADTGRLEIGPLLLRGLNVGEISLRVELTGVPNFVERSNPQALLAASLTSASLRYADASLFERVLHLVAKEKGVSAEELRRQFAEFVRMPMGPSPISAAELSLRDALASFVATPGVIEISARPDRPMPLAELAQSAVMAPDRMFDKLRLTASASK